MSVSDLITPVNAGSTYPTIPAGANRRIFATVTMTNGSATNVTAPTGVTIGGVAASFIGGTPAGTSQLRKACSTWGILESQIASMVGSAIIVTGQSGAFTDVVAWAVEGATQNSISSTANQFITTGAISISLARVNDSYTFFGVSTQVNEDITLTNPSRTSRISSLNIGYAADTERTVNSTGQSKTYVQAGHVINIPPVPAQTVTGINGGAGIKIGSTGNVAVTTGFTVDPDTITVGSLSGIITGYDSGTGEVTFDVPGPTHEDPYPDIDSTQTVTISVGSESAALNNVPFEPPIGSTPITVASPVNDDDRYLGYWMIDIFGITPVNGDKFYGIDADVTWTADTGGSATGLPVTTPVTYWDASTGIVYLLMVTVNPDGVVNAVGLVARGLTAEGLVMRAMTVRGL